MKCQNKSIVKLFVIFVFVILNIFFNTNPLKASTIDSLQSELRSPDLTDQNKLTILIALASEEQSSGNINSSLDFYKRAIDLSIELHDSIKLYNLYQYTAQLHGMYLRFDKSIEYKTKALKLSESMGNSHYIADAKMNIGIEYYSQKNFNEAIQHFQSALLFCKNNSDIKLQGTLTYLIALSYLRLERFEESKLFFEKAYTIIVSSKNYARVSDCLFGMSELELARGNIDTSITLLNKGLLLVDSISPGFVSSQKSYLLAKAYLKKGDLKMAEEFAKCSLDYYNSAGTSKYELADAILVMSEIYEAKGDYKNSLDYWKRYKLINDSVTSSGNQYKINTLLTGFQIDSKNQQIELLNRDKKIQILSKRILWVGIILIFIIAGLIYRNFTIQRVARKKSDKLLLNILPEVVVEELKEKGFAKAKSFENVTVLFTDFKNFSIIAERLTAEELVAELNICFTAFDKIIEKHGIEKIKTVGDAYLAVSGLPTATNNHALIMAKAAIELRDFMLQRLTQLGENTFEVRIGLNSGSVVAGIVGMNKFAYDIWGDTVNVAARMEQNCVPGKINISESTYNEIKGAASCTFRGMINAKNKGEINMYFLNGML